MQNKTGSNQKGTKSISPLKEILVLSFEFWKSFFLPASMELKEVHSSHFWQFLMVSGVSHAWKAFLQPAALYQVGHSILTTKICFIFWALQQLKAGSTVQCSSHVVLTGQYFGKANHSVLLGHWHRSHVQNLKPLLAVISHGLPFIIAHAEASASLVGNYFLPHIWPLYPKQWLSIW